MRLQAIVDEMSGEILDGSGAPGELFVRSALVMSRYWGKPEATAATVVSLPGCGNGWLRTGDVATLDAEGYLTIVDRKKDIIIRGGENVSCCEVEAAFFEHPAVMECAAFGLPHPRLGEEVGVVIMLKADAQSAATPTAALLATARAREARRVQGASGGRHLLHGRAAAARRDGQDAQAGDPRKVLQDSCKIRANSPKQRAQSL